MKLPIIAALVFTTCIAQAESSNPDSILKGADIPALRNLDYPELQVAPRASERLFSEATWEKSAGYWSNSAIEFSALTTLIAGAAQYGNYKDSVKTDTEKKDSNYAAYAAMAVGASWLGISYYLYQAEPYNNAAATIRQQKVTDKKSELVRERMAEEALERPARNMGTLTNLSVLSNFLASAYVISYANSDNRLYAGIAALSSLAPWIFGNRYVDTYNKHLEYKKRIFTPLSMTTLAPIQLADKTWTLQPEVILSWRF